MEPVVLKGSEILGEGFHAGSDYRVKLYDFKRPDKFSKDQIRTLSMVHETFARLATAELSAVLRSRAELHVASVDQLTYEEFLRSLPTPTLLAVVAMEPLLGLAVLEADPSVAYSMVERLFGGKGGSGAPRRDFTDLEESALRGILPRLLSGLGAAWAPMLALRPRLAQVETNPQFAQIVPPREMIVLVTLEAEAAGAKGMVNLALPFLTIEPIIAKLSAKYWYSAVRTAAEAPAVPVAELPSRAEVFFEAEALSLRDLARLRPGSLVRVPGYGKGTAFLRAGGSPLFRLAAERDRRTGRLRFAVTEGAAGADVAALVPAAGPEDAAASLQKALAPLSEQVGSALRTIEKRMEELSRRQEEFSDQLSFEKAGAAEAPRAPEAASERPFSRFSIGDCEALGGFLAQEHPQTAAMVLAHMDPAVAACVLGRFPPDVQVDVTDRVASIDRIHPEVLREADRVLSQKMDLLRSDASAEAGGVDAVVRLLNVATRGLEKHVVESLEKRNPALAEEIKRRMFVFEDIVLLDKAAIAKVVKAADPADVVLSLKAVEDAVRNKVWESVRPETAGPLQERLHKMGSVRLSEVEAAQMRVVGVIRRLEEEGEIVVARPGELV